MSRLNPAPGGGAAREKLATALEVEEIARIESEVGSVLSAVPDYVWNKRDLPVPIEEIAREVYGLRVVKVDQAQMREVTGDDSEDGYVSGLLLTGIGEIWICSWEAGQDSWGPQRTRFTVGHELGHFVMHQARHPRIFCRSVAGEDAPEEEPVPRPLPEVEANTFSGALLMPADAFRTRMGRLDSNPDRLRDLFLVSRKAAVRRIESIRALG